MKNEGGSRARGGYAFLRAHGSRDRSASVSRIPNELSSEMRHGGIDYSGGVDEALSRNKNKMKKNVAHVAS